PALDPPLGLEEQPELEERTIEGIGEGLLLVFTDGLFEALEGDRSSNERSVVTAARGSLRRGPGAVVRAAFEASEGERGERADDRTALAVRLETPDGVR
ncbi:MAG: SpoIIE family protein phosphatase, partial [Gemmatimonadota bacterium]|nr:SpoIIE family protein phosphatase [Gemmatimonadota bacterium]